MGCGAGEALEALEMVTRLEECWAVRRLAGIDLSVVPPWLVEELATANRSEHSVHVANLATLVSVKHLPNLDLDPLLLAASGLLHDSGCGPFPHISDELMRILLGWEHPQNVGFILEKSVDEETSVLEEFGLSPEEVCRVIAGKHKLSPFINCIDGGIDLDNIDNIYRYIATVPKQKLGKPSYKPLEVVFSMRLEEEKVVVEPKLARKWLEDKKKVYSYLENHAENMAAWVMLSRAMRLLIPELDKNFLLLDNRSAFSFLTSKLPEITQNLLSKNYKLLENVSLQELTPEIRSMVKGKRADWTKLVGLEDQICSELGAEKWSLGIEIFQTQTREEKTWKLYLVSKRVDENLSKIWRKYLGLV
ncbi:MAG: hypothetical protein DRO11_04650 [Methanobacteriota archaeon]|nr:MAG: hypothetical protein DRO11_04650 [Euryarchaeota archaeon]